MICELAIKIDVDTLKGYLEGVPRLLDVLRKKEIKASFFFSMGPDNSGKEVGGIFRKWFFARTRRNQTSMITASPDILKRAVDEGHDCGVRCWNHVLWQGRLLESSREEILADFERAAEMFCGVTGARPGSCAAPGWKVSADSLAARDKLGLDYASDVRGTVPFIPRLDGAVFQTLQIPATLPTLDELRGTVVKNPEDLNDRYLDLLEPGLNVYTAGAEIEGGAMNGAFARLLDCCVDGEMGFPTLKDVASRVGAASSNICDVEMRVIPCRSDAVAVQR